MQNLENTVDRIRELVDNDNEQPLRDELATYHSADIADIFQEMKPAILSQDIANLNIQTQAQAQVRQDAVALMFSGMISMPEISKLILQNSKQDSSFLGL